MPGASNNSVSRTSKFNEFATPPAGERLIGLPSAEVEVDSIDKTPPTPLMQPAPDTLEAKLSLDPKDEPV